MDGFTYTDIFETKGTEYIIIITFLLLLIPFWIIVNKQINVSKRINKVLGVLKASVLKIPQGVFYSKNHTWAYLEKSGTAKVGLDDFLLQIIGDVKINYLKSPGEKLKKGEVLAEINQQGKQLKIISPLSGEIIKSNYIIMENPEILQEDPYGKGFIYAIKPSNWKTDIRSFYLAEEASNWIADEMLRFKDFLSHSLNKYSTEPAMITYQEGGEIRQQILSELDAKIWEDFEDTFLN